MAWQPQYSSSYIYYQVIIEVLNTGTGWAQQFPGQSDYTILGPTGGVTATGSFIYAYPEFIGPGAKGYLFEDSLQDGVAVADFASVTADGRYDSVFEPDSTFDVTQMAWRTDEFSGGLTATGFVTVTSSAEVRDAALAVFCLGPTGQVLGGSYTNLLQNLSPATPKGFETVGNTPPLAVSQCITTVGYAQDTGF